MPELPDVELYVEHIARRIKGQPLEGIRLASPFLLRTVTPGVKDLVGRRVTGVSRLGKRIVIELEHDGAIVIHMMLAGRFRWGEPPVGDHEARRGAKIPGKVGHAAFDFSAGTLLLTEASTKKRATLHLFQGKDAWKSLDPGGIDVLSATPAAFFAALTAENHTLKRTLTDPRLFNGIGNAYSDEILHAARLSPVALTAKLGTDEVARLWQATRETLRAWTARLREEAGDGFPEGVTAFREGMAVHGRYRQPCPRCGAPVQRIRYAANETNYCAPCQTGGRLLANRSLSRLLRDDWPRTLEELESLRAR